MKTQVIVKADALERIVRERNLMYKDLARKLGITRVYMSALKSDVQTAYRPSADLRKKMMKVLKVRFNDIFEVVSVNGKRKKRG